MKFLDISLAGGAGDVMYLDCFFQYFIGELRKTQTQASIKNE
jgi:hypothetical protein